MIVGDNGVVNRTIVSKVTTEKVGIKERISLVVTSSLMDGIDKDEIDLNTLNDELIKNQITIIKKEEDNVLPWIVEKNNNIFKEGIGMLCDYNVFGTGYTAPDIYTSYIAGNRTTTWTGWGSVLHRVLL